MNGRTILALVLAFLVVFVLPFSVDAQKFPKGEYKYPPKPVPRASDDSGLKFVLGSDNFEHLKDLTNTWAYRAGRKVAHLSMNGWECSGFLVGPDLLMTNHHCLFDDDTGAAQRPRDIKVYMDYYDDKWKGTPREKGGVSAGVKQILKSSKKLDYALLRLDTPIGNTLGWVYLDPRTDHLYKGAGVAIVQHPGGRSKKVVRRDSSITQVYTDVIHYQADSEGGSSGSPVFYPAGIDKDFFDPVVAIHHAGTTINGVPYANEGILMKNIVPEIKQWLPDMQYNRWAYAAEKAQAGWNNFAEGRYDAAIDDYTEAIRINPKDADNYYRRGEVKHKVRKLDAAIADYTEAIRLAKDPRVYDKRGRAKYQLGRYEDAIDDYTEALRRRPEDPIVYKYRGHAKGRLGRLDAAIDDYTQAIRFNPKSPDVYYYRGLTKSQKARKAKNNLGMYNAAIDDFTKAIRLDPKDADSYFGRGMVKYDKAKNNLGRYEDAIDDFTKAIRLAPEFFDFYIQRGHAKFLMGRYDAAIDDYTEAVDLQPEDPSAYYYRGDTKHQLKRFQEARADYRTALGLAMKADDKSFVDIIQKAIQKLPSTQR